jgi:ATP-dependent DNA helicase HFM1/MER3
MDFFHIERLLSRNPPFGQNMLKLLANFPRLFLKLRVMGHVPVGGGWIGPPSAMIRVVLACQNAKQPPVWKDKVPSVHFVVVTHSGRLGYFWHGSMKELSKTTEGKVLTFTCDMDGRDANFEFACGEAVGATVRGVVPCPEALKKPE